MMKSTLLNMVLVLLGITLVASAALGFVYNVTKEPIAAAKLAKTNSSLALVLPAFDNDPSQEVATHEVAGKPVKVYTGRKDGQAVGYAVESTTKGYSGDIKLMVGFAPDGQIYNIEVLQQTETPGLGTQIAEPGNPLLISFQGKNPADLQMKVVKDGGDIDVISSSTISSRAYTDAVSKAYVAFQEVVLGEAPKPVDYLGLVLPEKKMLTEPKVITVSEGTATVVESYDPMGSLGFAVEVTQMGYVDSIRLMVGFAPDTTIYNVAVMRQGETPGLGDKITSENNALAASLKGKKATDIVWAFSPEGSVDAITGSTVTSEAYLAAIKRASAACVYYIENNVDNEEFEYTLQGDY